jgi:RNA polymerase sigma factor (sigma-70 family)
MYIEPMTVDELIEGCRRGSRRHFSELYDRFAPAMYGICLRYSGSADEAEDILQEGFIKVFTQLNKYDESRGSLGGWMHQIFVYTAIDCIRKRTLTLNLYPIDIPGVNGAAVYEEEVQIDLTQEQLLGMIRELPTGYRTVFNLHVIEEKSHKEIATLLGIAENTSRSQLLKARKMLQEKIKHYLSLTENEKGRFRKALP